MLKFTSSIFLTQTIWYARHLFNIFFTTGTAPPVAPSAQHWSEKRSNNTLTSALRTRHWLDVCASARVQRKLRPPYSNAPFLPPCHLTYSGFQFYPKILRASHVATDTYLLIRVRAAHVSLICSPSVLYIMYACVAYKVCMVLRVQSPLTAMQPAYVICSRSPCLVTGAWYIMNVSVTHKN